MAAYDLSPIYRETQAGKPQGKAQDIAAKTVCEYWNNFQAATQPKRQKLVNYYKQYSGIPNRRNYAGMANVFVNETLQAVESIVAQEFNTIFSEPKFVWLAPREETDKRLAEMTEALTLASLEQMGYKQMVMDCLRQRVKYGLTIRRVFWNYETKSVVARANTPDGLINPVPAGNSFVGQKQKVVYDNVDSQYIDLLDHAVENLSESRIENQKWIIVRKCVDWSYIQERANRGVYGNIELVERFHAGNKPGSYTSGKEEKTSRLQSHGLNPEAMGYPPYEILEMWGLMPAWWVDEDLQEGTPEGDELVEGVCEVVNAKTCVRLHRNPFWHQEKPFEADQFILNDNEWFGIGVCEIAEQLQVELNDKRNQLLDHASLSILPPLIRNKNSGINVDNIEIKPKKIISSNLPPGESLAPLQIGGSPQEIVAMDSIVKQDIRNQSGATNTNQGLQSPGDSTAFEIGVLDKRASSRINLTVASFTENFLKPFCRKAYQLLQQYVDTKRAVRVIGKEGIRWIQMSPEDLILDVDIIPKISTDGDSRIIVRNQVIQFLNSIAKYYPQINAYKLVRKAYDLFGFDDGDEVVPAPDTERGQDDLSVQQEMMVLMLGQKIDAKFYEDHVAKIDAATNFYRANGHLIGGNPIVKEAFEDYLNQHSHYLQVLEAAQAAMMSQRSGAKQVNARNVEGVPGKPRGAAEVMAGEAAQASGPAAV